jgi:hypothetical protein
MGAAIFMVSALSARLGDMDTARQYLELLRSIDPVEAKKLARCIKVRW